MMEFSVCNALVVRPRTTARTTERLHLASPDWRARRRLSNHARRTHRDRVSSLRPRETRLDLLCGPTRPSGYLAADLPVARGTDDDSLAPVPALTSESLNHDAFPTSSLAAGATSFNQSSSSSLSASPNGERDAIARRHRVTDGCSAGATSSNDVARRPARARPRSVRSVRSTGSVRSTRPRGGRRRAGTRTTERLGPTRTRTRRR